jgi:hypothetical protein
LACAQRKDAGLFFLGEVQFPQDIRLAHSQCVEEGRIGEEGVRGGEPPRLINVVAGLRFGELPDGGLGGVDQVVLRLKQDPQGRACWADDQRGQRYRCAGDQAEGVEEVFGEALVLDELADAVEAEAGDAVAFRHAWLPIVRSTRRNPLGQGSRAGNGGGEATQEPVREPNFLKLLDFVVLATGISTAPRRRRTC